jgi:hypothetical protein
VPAGLLFALSSSASASRLRAAAFGAADTAVAEAADGTGAPPAELTSTLLARPECLRNKGLPAASL